MIRRSILDGRPVAFAIAFAALLGHPAGRAAGQDVEDGYRFGVAIGGTSVIALVLERIEDRRGVELMVGTLAFRDVSLSLTGKAYLGPSAFRPVLGAGLWTAVGLRPREEERGGMAVIARFPVGFDWELASDHYLALELNVNRALWMRRADYSDNPASPRLIPTPAFSYRMTP